MDADAQNGDGIVTLRDGRRIGWHAFGAPFDRSGRIGSGRGQRIVIALHGTPGSRFKFAPAHKSAAERGLTLISLDRWGYGLTDRHPNPSLTAWSQDVHEVATQLGIERFAVCGISGGGPFAAALAAHLADRVQAAALVAPVGPVAAQAGRPATRLDPLHWGSFRVLPHIPWLARAVFAGFRFLLRISPRTAIAVAMARNGPADYRLLKDKQVVSGLAGMMLEGVRRSAHGPAIDLKLFAQAWDLDFAQVQAPVRIWFGDQDRNVPAAAVEALADAIPTAELERVGDQGHFWVSTRFDLVLDWLAQEFARHENAAQRG